MLKTCQECQGTGYVTDLDGDGNGSQVTCGNCGGTDSVENPDAERV